MDLRKKYTTFFANPERLPNLNDRSDDDLRMDEDKVESINPMYEDFKKSQESMFAPLVNKIVWVLWVIKIHLSYIKQHKLH